MQTQLLDNLASQYQIRPCFSQHDMESPATHSTYQCTSVHSGDEGSSSPMMPQRHKAAAQKSRFFREIDEALDSDSGSSSLSPLPFMHNDVEMADFKAECPSPQPRPMPTMPLGS